MKSLFSIGEASKIKDITIKTLRYYHKMGILIPKYVDKSTGYRYYSIDQFIYIDIIKGCRALDTSIVELQEIFKECDTDKLLRFLQVKRNEAEQKIDKMKEIIRNINILNESVEKSRNILNNDEVFIKYFNERYVIVTPCKEVGNLKELLYYSDLDKIIEDKNIEISLERGIIYNLSSDGIAEPVYAFNCIKGRINLENEDNIEVLPKGRYLILSYSKENIEERRNKIVSYVKDNNLTIRSFIEVELFNDIFNTESYSCQIQMLIDEN